MGTCGCIATGRVNNILCLSSAPAFHQVTDAVQALVVRCPSLESVSLMCYSKVTDVGVQALAEHLPGLESANLWWCARTQPQCTESIVFVTNSNWGGKNERLEK